MDMREYDAPGFDAPGWDNASGGMASSGSALICIRDQRIELATMLVLQELDVSVDIAGDLETAVGWMQQARYDVVVCGGGTAAPSLALRLRYAAPRARIVLLADRDSPPDELAELGVEVIRPPLDVNALMAGLRPAA